MDIPSYLDEQNVNPGRRNKMNCEYLYGLYPFVDDEIFISVEYDGDTSSDSMEELNFE